MRLSIFLLSILTFACIEPFDVPTVYSTPRVVVDGMINNDPGPYTVKLYLTSNLYQDLNLPIQITGAIVSIWDDAGNSEILTEESAGIYKTHPGGIQGIIGRSYQLKFTTPDGTAYESIMAKMQPAGQIKRLYFELKRNEINDDNPSLPQDVVNIYADAIGEEGYSNFLRWRSSGVFHAVTYPNLRTRTVMINGSPTETPDPLPCSIPDCACCNCWVTEPGSKAVISNNHVVNGMNFNRLLLKKVVVNDWVFSSKYYFEAEQISVQPEVYNFWKLVSIQQQAGDNIFQPNPVVVKGNIECTSDNDKKAYGIFSVSAVTRKGFFISADQIPTRPPVRYENCKELFRNATYIKPAFW